MTIPQQPKQPVQHRLGRKQFSAESGRIGRAAKQLAWGLTLLVIGTGLYSMGQAQALQSAIDSLTRSSYYSSSGGGALMVIGSLLFLFGLVGTITGIYRVAARFDAMSDRKLYNI